MIVLPPSQHYQNSRCQKGVSPAATSLTNQYFEGKWDFILQNEGIVYIHLYMASKPGRIQFEPVFWLSRLVVGFSRRMPLYIRTAYSQQLTGLLKKTLVFLSLHYQLNKFLSGLISITYFVPQINSIIRTVETENIFSRI